MLTTAFAKASTSAKASTFVEATVDETVNKSAVMMWKCCQSQCCQLSIGPRQARPLPGQLGEAPRPTRNREITLRTAASLCGMSPTSFWRKSKIST